MRVPSGRNAIAIIRRPHRHRSAAAAARPACVMALLPLMCDGAGSVMPLLLLVLTCTALVVSPDDGSGGAKDAPATAGAAASTGDPRLSAPTVLESDTFSVKAQLGVPYAMGVLCDPKPCKKVTTADEKFGGYDCTVCQDPEPAGKVPMRPSQGCPHPQIFNLTLDIYTPIGAEALGPRPAFVATHEGGYAVGTEQGCLLSGLPKDPARPASGPYGGKEGEMTAACRHFAARGWVAITMTYRLTNSQTGGALAPAAWSLDASPLNSSWHGGFKPAPRAIYPAVRDTKAAIRWLRGHAAEYNLATNHFGAGGWSAGACTTVFLSSQEEADFKYEMDEKSDPSFSSLLPHLNQSSSIQAGVVWAGNSVVTDTMNAISKSSSRYSRNNKPLAMYRGSRDTTMTVWAQETLQRTFKHSGVRLDLFTALNATHSGLFPEPVVQLYNGLPIHGPHQPVLNHSYRWISQAMGLRLTNSTGASHSVDVAIRSGATDVSQETHHNITYFSAYQQCFKYGMSMQAGGCSGSARPPSKAHVNLQMSSNLTWLMRSHAVLGLPGMLNLYSAQRHSYKQCQMIQCDNASRWPEIWSENLISNHHRPGSIMLSPQWQHAVEQVVQKVVPLAPKNGGQLAGVMVGDELVCGGFSLANMTALTKELKQRLSPHGLFIFTK